MAHTYQAGLVSIVIPVYNVAEYLPECLDSLLGQTYDQLEIICVNDGSTDDSGRVLDAYASKDARIRVIHKENGGVSLARNTAMQAARGEFITLVDGDDWLEPDTIERCIECAQQFPEVDFIEYGYVDVIESERQPFLPYLGAQSLLMCRGAEVLMSCVVRNLPSSLAGAKFFRSRLLEEKGREELLAFPIGRFHEDEIFSFRLSAASDCFVYLPRPLYNYRRNRPGATTSGNYTKRIEDMFINEVDLVQKMYTLDQSPLARKFPYPLSMYAATFMLHKVIHYSNEFYRQEASERAWLEAMLAPYIRWVGKHRYITLGNSDAIKKKLFLLNPRLYTRIKFGLINCLNKLRKR